MIGVKRQTAKYVLCDYVMSNIAWLLFNIVRFYMPAISSGYVALDDFLLSRNVLIGQLFMPLIMMMVYYLSGYYNVAFFKSRLHELFTTVSSTFLNTLILFFTALINDIMPLRIDNYELIFVLFALQFLCVYSCRLVITTNATHKIHNREWYFNTLVVGCGKQALKLTRELNERAKSLGYNIVGYVDIGEDSCSKELPYPVYPNKELGELCDSLNVKYIIVAVDDNRQVRLNAVINELYPLDRPIKMQSTVFHNLIGRVKLSNIYGQPLVDVSSCAISEGGRNMKRLVDIVISGIALIFVAPIIAIFAILIKRDSKGPVFYRQERIGYHHKPFNIYKLRTMYADAEGDGKPRLSSTNDSRITPLGKFMRKYRIDELPQFWNIFKGDMSLVGPRPEREYFIKQIIEQAPYYALMYQIRPGLTSWGMVKYGYAKNVDEMIERLQYDIVYLENMSMLVDLKIIIYTVRTVIMGRGM